jgi:SNF2 family DNA or RNA helicase
VRTVGIVTLTADAKAWEIQCEPHVAIRLKRVFGKMDKASYKILKISNTLENCRDLEWFIERFPMTVQPLHALTERAVEHKSIHATIDRLIDGSYKPRPFDLALPPREYQKIPAEIVLRSGGLLVADDVGLGKTAMAICTFTDPRTLPALVVTLTHLPRQWDAEIQKFAPHLRTHIIRSGQPYDIMKRKAQPDLFSAFPDILIVNYHKLSGWAETLAGVVNHVVFDEVQELRRTESLKYAAAKHIAERAKFRMGLSATPIYNYGGEMFSVLDVLHPGRLGTLEEFHREWCTQYSDKPKIKDPKAFGLYARSEGLMVRRTRHEVGRELPSLTKMAHPIDADTAALDRVGNVVAELARVILQQGESHRGEKMQASEQLSNVMRQATGIAKAPYVADFVRLLVESGEKVLLYGWHREVYSIWNDRLKDLKPVMFTGTESPTQKEAARQAFLGESQVLIMSLRAGAGLDGLQHKCRTVVFGELDWSPGVHEQCVGRVHRDGQPDPVMAYFLTSDFGADPVMVDVLGLKRSQIAGVRDPNAALVEDSQVDDGRIKKLAEAALNRSCVPPAHADFSSERVPA